MSWRPATTADDAALVALSLALYREDPSPHPVSAERMRATLARLRAEPMRGRAIVLDIAGRAAGFALLISYWSNELGGEVCTIDELYVEPAWRGVGYATQLIDALARGVGPWPPGAVAIALEVTPKNTRARALYERLGFRPGNLALRRPVGPPAAPAPAAASSSSSSI